jgi:hypothetical protein
MPRSGLRKLPGRSRAATQHKTKSPARKRAPPRKSAAARKLATARKSAAARKLATARKSAAARNSAVQQAVQELDEKYNSPPHAGQDFLDEKHNTPPRKSSSTPPRKSSSTPPRKSSSTPPRKSSSSKSSSSPVISHLKSVLADVNLNADCFARGKLRNPRDDWWQWANARRYVEIGEPKRVRIYGR